MLGRDVDRIEEVVQFKELFAADDALFGEHGGAGLFVHGVVLRPELAHHPVHDAIGAHVLVRGAGDDERRARLVDEDGVHLVHDDELLGIKLHVVAQIVEAEFVVGAVGDVRGVSGLAFLVVQTVHDDAGAQAEETVELAHPLGVATGEVIVDRHHMHALAGQRIERHGQRGHKGLALAGLHFGDLALVQDHAADELHVIVAHAQHAARGLPHQSKNLGQQIVQRLFPGLHGLPALAHAPGKVLVGQGLHIGFKRIDARNQRAQPPQIALVLAAEDFFEDISEHRDSWDARPHACGRKGMGSRRGARPGLSP